MPNITVIRTRDVARDMAHIYCNMSPMGIDSLARLLQPIKIPKGDMLVHEGDICKAIYYVHQGMVRQYYYKSDRDVTEHFSFEGRICFCIESFLKQEPSKLMVEALEPTLVYAIPHEDLHVAMMQNSEIELFYRKILEHALISSQEHADSQRFENAAERYSRLLRTHREIVLRAPLIHVASYLQMTPETLSRVRTAYNKEHS